LGGRGVTDMVIVSVIVSVDSFFNTLLILLALSVEASLAVELDGVLQMSPRPSAAEPLALPFPFSAALDVNTVVSLGTVGTGGLPIDSRFSTALAAAAFPAAALVVNDTAETSDLTEAVEGGRLGTGGTVFASPRLGRDAVLILAMDDVADAVDAVDVRRGRAVLPCSVFCRPAVVFEAADATDPRRVSLRSDFAVLNVVEVSLLFDAVETGLASLLVDVVETDRMLSFLVDSFELGLKVALEELAVAPDLRIVEACERTEAATDLGLSGFATLFATLFILDTVESVALDARDTRDPCEAWDGDLGAWDTTLEVWEA
jgi:hypothetical protein